MSGEDNSRRNILLSIGIIGILLVIGFQNIPYGGGWEATSYYSAISVDETTINLDGRSKYTYDEDGSIRVESAPTIGAKVVGTKPGITIEMGGPYYLQPSYEAMRWVETTKPYIVATYDRDYGNNTFLRYKYYALGYDVTIKTNAREIYKNQPPFIVDYGWTFEKDVVDVSVLSTFSITPWVPTGSEGDWIVTGGWSGVMKAVCVGIEHGLVEEGISNYGYTIHNLDSVNQNLNMYTKDGYFSGVEWGDNVSLAGVPYMVDVEHGARLGAGADFTRNQWPPWEWISGTPRNVFVKYTIKIDVLTALKWAPALGIQFPGAKPTGNGTDDVPDPAPWDDFLQRLGDSLFEWGAIAQTYALYILVIAGALVGLKFYWSRQDN